MSAPTSPEVRSARVRQILVLALAAASIATTLLPPTLTGVRSALAAGTTLPPPGYLASPALAAPAAGGTELFYPTTDGSLVHARWGAGEWTGVENLGGSVLGGAAAAGSGSGALVVTVRGSNNELYSKSGSTGRWTPWVSLGGVLSAKPGVASSTRGVDVFVRGSNGALYTRSLVSGRWSGWSFLGGVLAAGAGPSASALSDGSLTVVVHGTTGALYRKIRTPQGSWSGWTSLGGQMLSDPALATTRNRFSVFVRGVNNQPYERTGTGVSWTGWVGLGGFTTAGPAAAASPDGSRTDVVVMGTDRRLYQRTQAGSWSSWTAITPPASAPDAVRVPASGTWFGAQVNPRNGYDQLTSIKGFQAEIGRRLDIANKYHSFSDHNYNVEAALLAAGTVPLISWRGTDNGNDPSRAAAIAAGHYDATIAQTADALKGLRGGVLVRFNWEMDQSPGQPEYIGTGSQFTAAWQRIVTIFRSRGATNVAFVWAPRAAAFTRGVAASFYPGPSYVDWIGASAVPIDSWPSFPATFAAFYGWAAPTGKPLLAWAGVREDPASSAWKAAWMNGVAATLPTMPAVKAFVYYHALSPLGYSFWADSSPQALAAYKVLGCLSYFDTTRSCINS